MAQSSGPSNAHLDRLNAARDEYRRLLTAVTVSHLLEMDTDSVDDADTGPQGDLGAPLVPPAP